MDENLGLEEKIVGCRSGLDQLHDPVLIVEETGLIIFANRRAKDCFDFGPQRRIQDITSIDARFAFDPREVLRLIKRGSTVSNRPLKDERGFERGAFVDVSSFWDAKGSPRTRIVHFKDLSALKGVEEWKDEVISMVSHEIKNPLSAMKNVVSILLSQAPGPLTNGQRNFLLTAMRSIDRLTTLLESILDISRISAGRLELRQSWISLKQFVPEVVTAFERLFNVQRLELTWEVQAEVDRIFVDAAKLEQVLINLLSNALKFTPEGGGINLGVEAAGLESLSDEFRLLPWKELPPIEHVRFTVADTGIGMNEETLSNLFTRYYRSHSGVRAKGSHLGLRISKTLVEVQGGSLKVESELGLGTEVTFSLPKDQRTGFVVRSLNTMNSVLANLIAEEKEVTFFCVGKEGAECWLDLCKSWSTIPMINPSPEEVGEEDFLLWTFSEYLAFGMLVGGGEEAAIAIALEGWGQRCGEGAYRFDRCSLGLCFPPGDGDRLSQLFHISLKRMKRAGASIPTQG